MLMHDSGLENTGTNHTVIRYILMHTKHTNIRYAVDNRRQWTNNWDENVGTEECMLLRKTKLNW